MKVHPSILLVAGLAALLTSCASTTGSNARNTTRAQYLDEAWVAPELRGKALSDDYREVMIRRVDTGKLRTMGWWDAQSPKTRAELERDAAQLGKYMKNSFEKAVANHPGGRFRIVRTPSQKTLVIDLAITELVPSKKFWNATATGAGLVVPGAGLLSMAGKGSFAIEGRVHDGASNRVLAGFQNQESDDSALLNINQYTWYGGTEKKIDQLAAKTAEMLNTPKDAIVTKSSNFRLISN